MQAADRIQAFIDGLARRWRALAGRRLAALAALGVGLLWLAALAAWLLVGRVSAVAQVALVGITLLATVGWLVWVIWRRPPLPAAGTLARLVEDRYPGLEDRLATAVEVLEGRRRTGRPDGALDAALLADAAGRLDGLDADHVVPRAAIRRAGRHAAAALALVAVAGLLGREPATRAVHATWLYLSPDRLVLDVEPGDARVPPATPFTIRVRTTAAAGGLVPTLHVRVDEAAREVRMKPDGGDRFTFGFESVPASFTYRVTVAGQASPDYTVTLLEPPRVERIDLTYEYPTFTKLPPRTEEGGGDIYAPEGTTVRFRIHPRTTTAPLAEAALVLAEGEPVPLQLDADGTVSGSLTLAEAAAYRIRLRDTDGLENGDDPEYYVRLLDDRPPDVRILRPAGDRQVTPIEEVTIEARADDDHGLTTFELVYGVRGGDERAVPLGADGQPMSATGRHTIYLEDLDVAPGDFVSFYARAKDVGRGKRPTESQSDIFFLEVTPFVDEFALAQSQAMAAAGGGQPMDDLVRMQKDIIVGTWKLEKRAAGRQGAPSARDAKTLGRAQRALQQRAEMAARQSQMFRGGRRRSPVPIEEESALDLAAGAMGRAAVELDAVRIAGALPAEMEALNQLLRAQAEIRRRQITRQQAGAGGGGFNRAQQDLSTLFDRELQRQQQTNYETPKTAQEQRDQPRDELLERVRELARRQEALAREQADLARERQMEEAERRRRLERLSRDQAELQRQADQLARELAREEQRQASASRQQDGESSQGQRSEGPSGSQQADSQSGQQGGDSQSGSRASSMRQAAEEMKNAASELRREQAGAAGRESARALGRLREVERQLQANGPEQRRRALGDAQLEARQLAERQRQLAGEAPGAAGPEGEDQRRRLAGEQRQMAERAESLTRRLEELARSGEEAGGAEGGRLQEALRAAEGARIGERMRQVAEELEEGEPGATRGEPQRELARALDRLADGVAGTTTTRDAEGEEIADDLARARELRERLADLERRMAEAARQAEGESPDGQDGRGRAERAADREAARRRLADLQREYAGELQQAGELGRSLGRESPGVGRGMSTPEGQEMVSSAPGTEAFKQDFSRWETLHRDVTLGLERLEAALSQRLLEKAAQDRLRSGSADSTPGEYQPAVDRYYRTLASAPK